MKRTLAALTVALMMTGLAVAQRPGRPGGEDRTAALKEALNLSDAQIEAIQALQQTRRTRAQAIFEEIQQKRTALNALLDNPSADAASVGSAAIALRASENKVKAEQEWYVAELRKQLTGEQQQTLDSLIAAKSQLLGPLGLQGPGGRGGFGRGGRGGRR